MSAVKVRAQEATEKQIEAWLNLQQANRVLEGMLERRLQSEANLSLAEFEVLFRLELSAGHPLQMSEIAAQLISSPSGTTRIADRLERAGLIERETPRENRRVVHVKLTGRGRVILQQTDQAFREALHETFAAHLSDSDVDDLRGALRKVLESNGAWSEARCQPLEPKS